jgi:hypothetical protein
MMINCFSCDWHGNGRFRSAWRDGEEAQEVREVKETFLKRRSGGIEVREDIFDKYLLDPCTSVPPLLKFLRNLLNLLYLVSEPL